MNRRKIKSVLASLTIFSVLAIEGSVHRAFADTTKATNVHAFEIIAPNGERSVLTGTFHLDVKEVRQVALSEVDNFDRLVVESDSFEAEEDNNAANVDWLKFKDQLTGEEKQALLRRLSCVDPTTMNGVGAQYVFDNLPLPTLVGLAWLPCNSLLSESAELLKDSQLVHVAESLKIPVAALDDPETRSRLYNQVPPAAHLDNVRTLLSTDVEELYASLFKALNEGDFSAVHDLSKASLEPAEYQAIVVERNIEWLPSLKIELLKGNALVAVGAAHLGGENGIIHLLESDGFEVTPTFLSAEPERFCRKVSLGFSITLNLSYVC